MIRIVGFMLTIALSLGLDSFEQSGMGPFKILSKFHIGLQSFGIYLELFSQFLGGRIVKE